MRMPFSSVVKFQITAAAAAPEKAVQCATRGPESKPSMPLDVPWPMTIPVHLAVKHDALAAKVHALFPALALSHLDAPRMM